jgi:hypothetical protein
MSDNRCRYRAIRAAIFQLYPTEPKGNTARHLHTLAAPQQSPAQSFVVGGGVKIKTTLFPG